MGEHSGSNWVCRRSERSEAAYLSDSGPSATSCLTSEGL
jgi:hypothetical protein